jgi:tetratricopeptide (TPR) repeat protein
MCAYHADMDCHGQQTDLESTRNCRGRHLVAAARAGVWILLLLFVGGCSECADQPVRVVIEGASISSADAVSRGLGQLIAVRLRAVPGVDVRMDALGCAAPDVSHAIRVVAASVGGLRTHAATITTCGTGREETQLFVQDAGLAADPTPGIVYWLAERLGVLDSARSGAVQGSRVPSAALVDYLAAVGQLQRRDAASVATARDLLRRAVGIAPNFADAHAELAIAELLASEYGLQSTDEALRSAATGIAAAAALEPEHGLAQAARGLASMVAEDYRAAVPLLREAHRRLPGHDAVLLWLGNAHLYAAEPREAQTWLQAAREINPDLTPVAISLGEAACYSADEVACRAFLEMPSGQPMRRFVTLLLRAHRGERKAVLHELRLSPPAVAESWIWRLKSELCLSLADADAACAALGAAVPDTPEADMPLPADFELDLWRLDLGLRPAIARARGDTAWRAAVAAELDRAKNNGLALPVVAAATACLSVEGDVAEADLELMRLLGCRAIAGTVAERQSQAHAGALAGRGDDNQPAADGGSPVREAR